MLVKTDLEFKNGSMILHEFSEFPENPKLGQICFKEDGVYIYSKNPVTSENQWRSLATSSDNGNYSHVHTQASASTTWTINHNLGTTDVFVACYNEDNERIIEQSISFTNDNTVVVTFLSDVKGKALVLSAGGLVNSPVTRLPGEIFYSLLPINDAGVHLLDGTKLELTGIYSDFGEYIKNLYSSKTKANVDITGILTNDNNVLSGFSTGNYASLPDAFDPESNTWKIVLQITTGDDVTTRQILLSPVSSNPYNGISVGIESGKIIVGVGSDSVSSHYDIVGSGSSLFTTSLNVAAETNYKFTLEFTGTSYIFTVTDDEGTIQNQSGNSSLNVGTKTQIFGTQLGTTDHFLGSIDFKECYIEVNEEVTWVGEKIEESSITKSSNVEKIGNVVDTDGVLGGFSAENYAKFPSPFNPGSDSWEMVFKVKTGNDVTTAVPFFSGADSNVPQIAINIESSKFSLYLGGNGSSWDIANNVSGISTVITNTDYYVKVVFNGTSYIMSSSADGESYTTEVTITSSVAICSNTIRNVIGTNRHTTVPFSGSVDLNESYININGYRWWTGRTSPVFCSENEFQGSVGLYGTCGKFVYDSVNRTVRLPKISGFIEGTLDASKLGGLVEAGLPNITGEASPTSIQSGSGSYDAISGALQLKAVALDANTAGTGTARGTLTIDASRSSSIYGNSDTVQPQSTLVYVYIVIANSTKTPVQVDIDNVAADLNGKASTDLANVNSTGKVAMAHAAMPSGQYIDLTLPASNTELVAPADGFVMFRKEGDANQYIGLFAKHESPSNADNYSSTVILSKTDVVSCFLPVAKNQRYVVSYNATGVTQIFRFIYANGSAPA